MVQLRHLNNDVGELKNIPNLRSFAIEQEFKIIVHVMLSIILGYVDFNSFQINVTVWCSLPFAYYIDTLVEKSLDIVILRLLSARKASKQVARFTHRGL